MKHPFIAATVFLHAGAWAHAGHGIESYSHWHATDIWGWVMAASLALWLWGRHK